MFYYVSGTVAHVEPYLAVIDCGGVGYACIRQRAVCAEGQYPADPARSSRLGYA